VVSAIEIRSQAMRLAGIAYGGIEVNHRIKVPRGTNPTVYRLPIGLAQRPRMVIIGTDIRRDGRADHTNPMSASPSKNLLVGS